MLTDEQGWTPNTGDMPERWAGYCDRCCEPITRRTWFERLRAWLAYRLVMALPLRFIPIGHVLPFAGEYAFECCCDNRNAALRAKDTQP